MFAQRLCQLLSLFRAKAKVGKETFLACAEAMRRIEQIFRDLISVNHGLACVRQLHQEIILFKMAESTSTRYSANPRGVAGCASFAENDR